MTRDLLALERLKGLYGLEIIDGALIVTRDLLAVLERLKATRFQRFRTSRRATRDLLALERLKGHHSALARHRARCVTKDPLALERLKVAIICGARPIIECSKEGTRGKAIESSLKTTLYLPTKGVAVRRLALERLKGIVRS